ncbi:hypothetical protein LTR70_003595 [Exophiala xenobiotica]|uniref:Chalcone isomerase domain-containing protein n=1 Tax=Lithohypha guttulata TaxID=1690604 RepID=A0ABR0KHQ3_9EURO|nr:hypothetical protein LTR24_003214 [Lithohypha guttulata]KAK5322808.1 hypothetical protein LTR70_003595 [Exophiala xenobiotica]
MQSSPLQTLVTRHVCTCARRNATLRPFTRAFVTSAARRGNAPIPSFVGSPDDLKRKYQPKHEEHDRAKIEHAQIKSKNRKATAGIIVTTLAMFGTVFFWPGETKLVKNDGPAPNVPGVIPDTSLAVDTVETGTSSVPTFPKMISLAEGNEGSDSMPIQGDQEYQLIGLGIRTVSFLGIQVYVVGMYIAVPDIATLQERLIRTQDPVATTLVPGEKDKLRDSLLDAERSEDIWNEILRDGKIRSVFRIVPTRNTDFSHLKDGFLRQLTAKTQHFSASKNDHSFSDEAFGQSVDQFKALFSLAPRKNLPKGEILLLSRDAKGRLQAYYEDPKGNRTKFGNIMDERISRLVWLQYLSGKTPSSEGARKSVVDGVMEYVARPVGTVATQVL